MSLTPFRINNKIILNLTQNSTSLAGENGSLVIKGGMSISKDIYIGGALQTESDIRLKENLVDLSGCIDRIDNIRTVRYNYIKKPQETHIGFIANDFLQDFPEIVKTDETGYLSMDYSKLTPILLNCIKDLKARVVALEARV